MSGYAQNPSSSSDPDYAPLTAGLLARKGEALPAVDADAHAGVDIGMHRAVSAKTANKGFTRQTVDNLYPPNSNVNPNHTDSDARQEHSAAPTIRQYELRSEEPKVSPTISHGTDITPSLPPENLISASPSPRHQSPPSLPAPSTTQKLQHRKAIIRFRMGVEDLVRLRLASRDMEMSCQAIILEALECYLDANDIAPVTDEACKEELSRLAEASSRKRVVSQTVAVDE